MWKDLAILIHWDSANVIVLISEQDVNPLHQAIDFSFYCMKIYLLETQLHTCLWGAEGQRSAGLDGSVLSQVLSKEEKHPKKLGRTAAELLLCGCLTP